MCVVAQFKEVDSGDLPFDQSEFDGRRRAAIRHAPSPFPNNP